MYCVKIGQIHTCLIALSNNLQVMLQQLMTSEKKQLIARCDMLMETVTGASKHQLCLVINETQYILSISRLKAYMAVSKAKISRMLRRCK